jgi:hypothetical protein
VALAQTSWLAPVDFILLESSEVKIKNTLLSAKERYAGIGRSPFQRLYCGGATPTQPSPIEGPSRGRAILGSMYPDLPMKIVMAIERNDTGVCLIEKRSAEPAG